MKMSYNFMANIRIIFIFTILSKISGISGISRLSGQIFF